jgi:hypothetical protein
MGVSLHGFLLETGFQTEIKKTITKWVQRKLTHSVAPSPAFKGGVKRRRSGSTLSKPQHLCWGVEGLTRYWHYSDKLYRIKDNSMLQRDSMWGTKLHLQ